MKRTLKGECNENVKLIRRNVKEFFYTRVMQQGKFRKLFKRFFTWIVIINLNESLKKMYNNGDNFVINQMTKVI